MAELFNGLLILCLQLNHCLLNIFWLCAFSKKGNATWLLLSSVFIWHDLWGGFLLSCSLTFCFSTFPCHLSLLSVAVSALAFCVFTHRLTGFAWPWLIYSVKYYCKIHFLFLSYNFFVWIIASSPAPFSTTSISLLLFDHHCLLWVLFCVTPSSHLFFHSHVSPPVGAGCARRPSSISLTCRSTPNRTQRPNLTSVLTVTSHSPTPATWPSTSVSTAGPSPTPAPTARNLSGNSVIYSSTHGTSDNTTPYRSL